MAPPHKVKYKNIDIGGIWSPNFHIRSPVLYSLSYED